MTLSEYLRNRGINFDPIEIKNEFDPITSDELLLKEASELWVSKQPLITMVLQARINSISKHILESCTPEEVLVYRQALVEIGAIVTDFEGYKAEMARRKATKDKEEGVEVKEKAVQVPPKEGAESSL